MCVCLCVFGTSSQGTWYAYVSVVCSERVLSVKTICLDCKKLNSGASHLFALLKVPATSMCSVQSMKGGARKTLLKSVLFSLSFICCITAFNRIKQHTVMSTNCIRILIPPLGTSNEPGMGWVSTHFHIHTGVT